ncbi:hypothetical protein GCM10010512_03630 [Streptomyces thermoviolaceus subsp. thermoviolaceus]|nr:hypothetical protein GCM10010512_03630 [Streptomyces thermoviolaceus subsp. thermoviolaceus]
MWSSWSAESPAGRTANGQTASHMEQTAHTEQTAPHTEQTAPHTEPKPPRSTGRRAVRGTCRRTVRPSAVLAPGLDGNLPR